MDFAWAKSPADHMDQYVDLVGSSQGKGVPSSMMAQMKRHASYVAQKLTPEQHAKLHKNISAHANRLVKDDEISAEEAAYIKKTYSPPVKESTDMDIQEKKMTDAEMKKREKMVKSMKKNFGDFKKRYGERAKEVMYATATKQAMKSEEVEQTEQIDEALSDAKTTAEKLVKKSIASHGIAKPVAASHFAKNANAIEKTLDRVRASNSPTQLANAHTPVKTVTAATRRFNQAQSMSSDEKKSFKTLKSGVINHLQNHLDQHHKAFRDAAARFAARNKTNEDVEQTEELEGQHYCAKHVYSDVFGEGVVVEGQHADPDENGNIEWYTVQFEHGEEVIFTEDVEVMMAEYHMNHSPMKKKAKKAKE